jgi:hypothetical protein
MTDQTTPEKVKIDNPEQASTNFYWTYEYMNPDGQSQVFNFQTTFRGVLSYEQMKEHIKMALEGTAHIAELGGQAKQIGNKDYYTPAQALPQPDAVGQVITEQANLPFPTEEPSQPATAPSFAAEKLFCEKRNDKMYFKVKGGTWMKYGVTVWNEVLVKAGIQPSTLNVGEYTLKGYQALYTLKADGKPEKVIELKKVA